MLTLGADPNCTSENLGTHLIMASRNRSDSIVRPLFSARTGSNLQVEEGMTALMPWLLCSETASKGIVRLLVDSGADINVHGGSRQITALMIAVYYAHTNIVQYILDEGADGCRWHNFAHVCMQ